jgi:hypothetical protein
MAEDVAGTCVVEGWELSVGDFAFRNKTMTQAEHQSFSQR